MRFLPGGQVHWLRNKSRGEVSLRSTFYSVLEERYFLTLNYTTSSKKLNLLFRREKDIFSQTRPFSGAPWLCGYSLTNPVRSGRKQRSVSGICRGLPGGSAEGLFVIVGISSEMGGGRFFRHTSPNLAERFGMAVRPIPHFQLDLAVSDEKIASPGLRMFLADFLRFGKIEWYLRTQRGSLMGMIPLEFGSLDSDWNRLPTD